ncbi:MAG: hypothetical protein K2M06_04485 [Muribaculaceae bacterium]|nr:hypothetical protein [Muribaculaceae bacterium]
MAENNTVKSRREQHLERLRKKYPDKKFEDDEEIYGQISDDYDEYEQELAGYKGREKTLSDMFAADPRSAQLLTDMHNGQDPVLGLVRNFGVEIKDVLDDPEMQEKIAEANKDFIERAAKSKKLDEEYEANMRTTLDTLRTFQEERGMSDEDIDKVVELILTIVRDGVMGKFSTETLEMACKALNYEADVAAAGEEGEIAGRNSRIVEDLRKSKKGDGIAPLGGKNGEGGGAQRNSQTIFDLANDAI